MSKSHESKQDELRARISRLEVRFQELGAREGQSLKGYGQVATGLSLLVSELNPEARASNGQNIEIDATRLRLVLQGLEGLADHLAAGYPTSTKESAPVSRAASGLQQFISAFRNEAQKRLSGLSISMMGIFSEQASAQSLDQSAGHLHAIRGGAAMLNLETIAELSGAMEQVIVTMRRLEPSERTWPTSTLLRGFSQLRQAANDEDARIDAESARLVIEELRHCLSTISTKSAPPANSPGSAAPSTEIVKAPVAAMVSACDSAPTPGPTTSSQPEAQPDSRPTPTTRRSPVDDEAGAVDLEQRILIIDDVETIAASVGFILSELEVPIDIANDGEMALKMLRQRAYSLVISDVAMPKLDGITLTRMLRDDEELRHLPVILLTSLDHPEERKTGLAAGATDYIIKGSIGGGELLGRVRDLLKVAPFVVRVPKTAQRRILVAEDTETVAASIAFVLSEGDHDIVLAPDGKDALGRLDKSRFDLLITDVQMPRMSGLELVRAVRARPDLCHLPIVMLTSLDSEQDRDNADAAGADRYLVKGEVGGGKLLQIVEELLALPSS